MALVNLCVCNELLIPKKTHIEMGKKGNLRFRHKSTERT